MTRAWVEAGKGIPVWVGARVIERDNTMAGTVVHVRKNGRIDVWCGDHCEDMDDAWFPGDCVPDLTDPDTRAMYLRRLAIARGCPDDIASQGVIFYPSDGDYYDTSFFMKAGCAYATDAHHRPRGVEWRTSFKVGHAAFHAWDANPCLALALAWPADKRVTT